MKTQRQKGLLPVKSNNPFNTGSPARDTDFCGRTSIMDDIRSFVQNRYPYTMLIYGQRRIGKTSLLRKIQNEYRLSDHKKCVYFNLQNMAKIPLSDLLTELHKTIFRELGLNINLVPEKQPHTKIQSYFLNDLLPYIFRQIKESNLILMFDEFDVLGEIEDIEDPSFQNHLSYYQFVPFIVNLIEKAQDHHYPVKIISAIGRSYKDLNQARFGQMTKFGLHVELLNFSKNECQSMIHQLCDPILPFDASAIDMIFNITNGHPYFTQCLASTAFDHAEKNQMTTIQQSLIEENIVSSIKKHRNGVYWIWESLDTHQKIILYMIAIILEEKNDVSATHIQQKAKEMGFEPAIKNLNDHLGILIKHRYIHQKNNAFSFHVEFIRKWIVLENSKQDINHLMKYIDEDILFWLRNAKYYFKKGNYDESIDYCMKIYESEPDHFEVLLYLGKCHANKKNVDQALEFFRKANAINPDRAKNDYLYVLQQKLAGLSFDDIAREEIIKEICHIDPLNTNSAVVIFQLEKEIGRKLNKLESIDYGSFGYILDKNESVVGLGLFEAKLKKVPDFVLQLVDLESLNLRNNQLSDLPKEIAELKSLQDLDLSSNQLSDLPKEIAELKSLQDLDLSNNQLSDLPKEIAELKSLKYLDLSFNQLSDLPKEIAELKSLQYLGLSSNQLSDLPKEIAELKSLQALDLGSNQLSDLPKEIAELKSLQYLGLSSNQLSDLPKEIAELKSLQYLHLHSNQLSDLPKEIAELKMEIHWTNDYTNGINLYNNPLKHPPIEIVQQGKEKVLNYFKSIEKESIKLFEAKLLIVGEGGVGKTCLMNRIIHNQVNEEEITTEGIDIQKWSIKTEVSDHFRVNFWDFGGQEIYNATHQFFLTKRSFYILLWEARKDNDLTHFDYWLNIIRLLSDNSPVLIVLNKIDERINTIDEQYLQQSFTNIVGFHKVSATQNVNMDGLIKDIIANITKLDHIGDTLPKAWLDIRKQLEDLAIAAAAWASVLLSPLVQLQVSKAKNKDR
jgi:small GTP-binding protein